MEAYHGIIEDQLKFGFNEKVENLETFGDDGTAVHYFSYQSVKEDFLLFTTPVMFMFDCSVKPSKHFPRSNEDLYGVLFD